MPEKNGNGWAVKALYFAAAVALAYFSWLGIAIIGIGREVSAMRPNVDRLVAARDSEQTQRTNSNSDRLDDIEGTRPQAEPSGSTPRVVIPLPPAEREGAH